MRIDGPRGLIPASCPNPWHQTAPARRVQLCPECPFDLADYRGCTFDLGVGLAHLPDCACPDVHQTWTCWLNYVAAAIASAQERMPTTWSMEQVMNPIEWQHHVKMFRSQP